MRVQFDAAQIHDPGQSGRVVNHQFFRGAAGREGKRDGTQPIGVVGGGALLIKRLTLGSIDEALQHDGTVANPIQRARCDRQVVAHQVEF